MKVLLSWLNEYGDFGDPADPAAVQRVADALTSLGLPVEDDRARRRVGRRRRHGARRAHSSSIPTRPRCSASDVDAGDGVERHVWCGAFNMQPGDVVPLATLGTDDARRSHDRTARHPRHRLRGHAVLGPRARARRRPRRHPHPARGHSARRAVRRRPRPASPTCCSTSTSPATGPTAGATSGIARDLAAKLGVEFRPPTAGSRGHRRRPRRAASSIVDGDRCGRFTSTVHRRASPSARRATWMARAADRRRDAADQQRRRREQLRDARARPAEPRRTTSPRSAAAGSASARRADGERITTLDGHRAHAHRGRPVDLRRRRSCRSALAGIMGGARHRDQRRTTTSSRSRWPGSSRSAIAQTVARLGLRSEASARFERGVDPYGIDTGDRPLRRAARRDVPRARRARRRRRRPRRRRCPPSERSCRRADQPGQPDPRHRRSRPTTSRRCSTRSATPSPARATSARWPCRRGAPTRPPRSTSSRRSPATTATTASARRVPKSVVHGGAQRAPAASPAGCARCCSASGSPRRCRTRSSRPTPWRRPGSPAESLRVTNPLVAEESVLRTSLRPGLLQAIAFNESHRRSGVRAVRDRPRLPARRGRAADEYEALGGGPRRRGGARRRSPCGESSPRRSASARASTRSTVPAGLHPTRSATLSGRTRAARRRRRGRTRRCSSRFDVTERVADPRARPAISCSTASRSRPQWKPTSRYPSSDLDLAFVAARRRRRPSGSTRRSGRAPATLLVDVDAVRRVPRGSGARRHARSLAYRLRLQAPDRNLTDADIAGVRRGVEAAATKLGADLRS